MKLMTKVAIGVAAGAGITYLIIKNTDVLDSKPAQQLASTAMDLGEQARDTATDLSQQAKSTATQLGDQARSSGRDMFDQAKDAAADMAEQAKDTVNDVRESAMETSAQRVDELSDKASGRLRDK